MTDWISLNLKGRTSTFDRIDRKFDRNRRRKLGFDRKQACFDRMPKSFDRKNKWFDRIFLIFSMQTRSKVSVLLCPHYILVVHVLAYHNF
jgi:hypothetical protein